ncbi:MAG: aminotransferase class I/II-fold pyridoxal phosphate-dependent enzyme [Lachnospiraceae bacterium]
MDKLESALKELENSDMYPFHMPGHKRKQVTNQLKEVYAWDITEIDGFDNLHHPEGIIKEEQEFAAELFGAEESFFLINGSSSGVLSAIATVASDYKSRILMGRNAHKSAYNALYLTNTKADYLYPECIRGLSFAGPITAKSVEEALKKNDSYDGIYLTSPTYEGVLSDIKAICEIAHEKGIPVIVDEAHGAHLGIWGGDGYFPSDAVAHGADIVIQSLHKTLPSMTQTAILHVQGKLIDRQKLKMHLGMFQSSSPSYILMESIISCLHYCKKNKKRLAEEYKNNLERFYRVGEKLSHVKIWNVNEINRVFEGRIDIETDPGKIVIGTVDSGLTGKQLYDILREKYYLQMEMAAGDYVIAMTSVMDSEKGFERLAEALREIDAQAAVERKETMMPGEPDGKPEVVYTIGEAIRAPGEAVVLEESKGRISQEFVYLYPPGIPLIVPGEKMTEGLPAYIKQSAELGLSVRGLRDNEQKTIFCIK